jgi:hypothetical protein
MAEEPQRPLKRKPKRKMTGAEQSERFKETARALGVDETGAAFERVFRTIVSPKHRPKTPP